MNSRGRFAQSLQPIAALGAPRRRPWLWSSTSARWGRSLQRSLAPIVALNPPRGTGASAAALLLLASTCYGVVKGGHAEAIAAQVQDICDSAANSLGFGISEIALAGQHEVGRDNILSLAGVTSRSSLLFLDAARTRARLLSDPWIADATVLKLYPGRLRIGITERKPYALWQKDGAISLIAADGTVLEPNAPERFLSLPLLVGRGAERAGRAFLDIVNRHPTIAHMLESSVLIADRRWSLHLKGGLEVLLPEHDPSRALQTLVELEQSKKLLSRDIVLVDLRLPDRVTVRLSDAAAAQREEAIRAADKDKKKRKGGEV
jgi:cell division protein FtsQ